ncbi:ABC transporter ATP-binding protein [bacterium]|nr:ABC transporter ATP-binding protein [bacterium]
MIDIVNLNKKFADHPVIDNLSLSIEDGEITALVGANGAGKSTLIRLLSGLYKPDSGKIFMNKNTKIGVLLGGDVNLYKNLTGFEIVQYFGKLHGLNNNDISERINSLIDILHMKDFINKPANTFSRGMKQKVALTISIIHNPDVLFLDEPSTGMDIEASNDVINFIKYLKKQNKTILIATHNIFEISDLSDKIAFINNGKIHKKVATKMFFNNCPQDEKNAHIISAMKGG